MRSYGFKFVCVCVVEMDQSPVCISRLELSVLTTTLRKGRHTGGAQSVITEGLVRIIFNEFAVKN